jgi:hypothetical protein
MSGWIKDEIDFKKVADGLTALYRSDPENYSSIMSQLINKEGLDVRWRLAVHLGGNSRMMLEVVQAIKKPMPPLPGFTEKDYIDALPDRTKEYVQAALTKGNWNALTGEEIVLIQGVILNKAHILHNSGAASSPKDAVAKAADSFLHQRYTIVSRGGGLFSGTTKNSIAFPKVHKGVPVTESHVRTMTENLNRYTTKEGIRSLGLEMPESIKAQGVPYEKYLDKVRLNGKWAISHDGNYAELWYQDTGPQSGETPVVTEQSQASVPRAPRRVITRVPLELLMTPGHAEMVIKKMEPVPADRSKEKAIKQRESEKALKEILMGTDKGARFQ